MVPLVILPMVPLVANDIIGLPMVPLAYHWHQLYHWDSQWYHWYYRVIALISANIVPSLDIEGRELASVRRYLNEGQYSPISVR